MAGAWQRRAPHLIHQHVRAAAMQDAREGHQLVAPAHLLGQLVGPIPAQPLIQGQRLCHLASLDRT